MIKVSIITVCFNSAKTINETLHSVTTQRYPNIEYIIIDGGSTDHTLDIIQKYRANIATLRSEKDKGIYDAMNKGIAAATGEVIGLLNADDLYAHEDVISQVAQIFNDPSIDACFGDLVYFSDKAPDKIVRYWRSGPFVPNSFVKGWCPPHPTFFVRRSVYERLGTFNTNYAMGNDVELMMRFLEKHRINSVHLSQVLVKMRLGGVSNRSIGHIIQQNLCVLKAAKQLNMAISIPKFIFYKFFNRVSQFMSFGRRIIPYDK